jgi:hypothetical protein
MRYNWDFTQLRNLAPLDGGETKYKTDYHVSLPPWMQGLALRETRQLSPDESKTLHYTYRGKKVVEVTDRILPAGKAWIEAVYADLEGRFPHGEEGPGFFLYESVRGVCLIYNPGFDMYEQWGRIFGVAAPMFTNCHRAPVGFRPWKPAGSMTPTVFYNGTRNDWAPTDSLGAPYFGHTTVQTRIDWAYCAGDSLGELVPVIIQELGRAAVAWECRVQPPVPAQ